MVRSGEDALVHAAVRVDASLELGTGHVMRCLTLAGMLRARGARILFICREHPGHLCDLIQQRGFEVRRLPASAADAEGTLGATWQDDADQSSAAVRSWRGTVDLLVVDHYGIDRDWEEALRGVAARVLVMDDLADRPHSCDVLLDQGLHDAPGERYAGLVDASTRVFVGPCYAMLRPEFDRFVARQRDGLQRALVFFGGTDPSGETLKVLAALRTLASEAPESLFVLGPVHPQAAEIKRTATGLRGITIVDVTDEMARLMADADVGIGTCGGAAWERCALGLPSLVVVNADNQRDDARILGALGAIRNLGDAQSTTVEQWTTEIRALRRDAGALTAMSRAAAAVMRGRKEAMQELEAALVA
jgi:UDP-2,4-diacetamido-2,4,6-trideoxy-beta-L-altropyranose hydrolase